MKYLTLLITVPLSIFAVLFAVSNGASVQLTLWPFEFKQELPVNLLALGFMGGGFFLGALFVWILDQKMRFKYWQETRKSQRLEKELEALHASPTVTPQENGAPISGPALLASK